MLTGSSDLRRIQKCIEKAAIWCLCYNLSHIHHFLVVPLAFDVGVEHVKGCLQYWRRYRGTNAADFWWWFHMMMYYFWWQPPPGWFASSWEWSCWPVVILAAIYVGSVKARPTNPVIVTSGSCGYKKSLRWDLRSVSINMHSVIFVVVFHTQLQFVASCQNNCEKTGFYFVF